MSLCHPLPLQRTAHCAIHSSRDGACVPASVPAICTQCPTWATWQVAPCACFDVLHLEVQQTCRCHGRHHCGGWQHRPCVEYPRCSLAIMAWFCTACAVTVPAVTPRSAVTADDAHSVSHCHSKTCAVSCIYKHHSGLAVFPRN